MGRPEEIRRRALAAYQSQGTVGLISPAELAAEIDRSILGLVQVSLVRALKVGRRLAGHAAKSPVPVQLASYRALARAALMSSQYREACDAYLKARHLTATDRISTGRIDRTLADVYMYLGDFAESKRRVQMALRAFTSLGDKSEIAKAQVNYANLLHRQDRHREAERLYRQAAEHFESSGDELSAARCWFNRANTLVQLFFFAEAEALYRKSEEVYRRHGQELDAVDALWGRSWLHMLEGTFHLALQELAECEKAYLRIGRPLRVASCVLDRAEVFLNLNLFDDAHDCAAQAERQFLKLGVRYEAAKAGYYRAVAAEALGQSKEALTSLRKVRRAFAAEKNIGFLGASQLLAAQLCESPTDRRRNLKAATRLFSRAQLPLWNAVADIHASFDPVLIKSALIRLSRNGAARQVPHLYAAWQTRLGDVAAMSGKHAKASSHWELAADRLDQVRAQLPPVGLRSKYGNRLQSPHSRLVISNLGDNPKLAAAWSERYKTAGIWRPTSIVLASSPSRKRVEDSLLALAGRFAALSSRIGSDGERSVNLARSSAHISRLQREVRQELLAFEDSATAESMDNQWLTDQFERVSQELPVVQFHASTSELIAFVHESGRTRVVRYSRGPQTAGSTLAQWNFLLETAALGAFLPAGTDHAAEERFFEQVGEWLWKPLDIASSASKVLLFVEGPLTNIPWHAIRVDGEPIARRNQLLFAPSLRHYLHAQRPKSQSDRSVMFVGSRHDLPAVTNELESIRWSLGDDTAIFDPCRRNDWPIDGRYRSWHFSGHARLNEQNPFYSALQLEDGPLFAADFRLRRADVDIVTLAACETGAQLETPGEESTGLVRSLIEMGARSVVASQWPVADGPTALWMGLFYSSLNDNMKPIEAAQSASLSVREKFPSAYHWAAFSVYGAGI